MVQVAVLVSFVMLCVAITVLTWSAPMAGIITLAVALACCAGIAAGVVAAEGAEAAQ
jgi:hypothetical protein